MEGRLGGGMVMVSSLCFVFCQVRGVLPEKKWEKVSLKVDCIFQSKCLK